VTEEYMRSRHRTKASYKYTKGPFKKKKYSIESIGKRINEDSEERNRKLSGNTNKIFINNGFI
jgi:hypothetical protein